MRAFNRLRFESHQAIRAGTSLKLCLCHSPLKPALADDLLREFKSIKGAALAHRRIFFEIAMNKNVE